MKVHFKNWDCVVKQGKYIDNNNTALVLFEEITGEIIAKATVNTGETLPEDFAFIKDYSENEGVLEALKNAGIIKEIVGKTQLGYVEAPLVKLDLTNVPII